MVILNVEESYFVEIDYHITSNYSPSCMVLFNRQAYNRNKRQVFRYTNKCLVQTLFSIIF